MLTSLTSPDLAPVFWRPARTGVESAWYGHVPFAHWIVAALRPRMIVELGAHNGVSYAAFCESVQKLGLDCRCLAVDTWQGDEHAGFYGDEVFADLQRFHATRYGAFSELLRSTFDAALAYIPDGSVDLLHIDGRHHYDDVAHDFATWLPKLSARGVVLLHDTNVRENDFGVWRLWAELRHEHAGFEFLHGHGLGVLCVGAEVPAEVASFCTALDGEAANAVRERFAILGERWIAAYALQREMEAAEALRRDLTATKDWAETAQSEVNRLFPAHRDLLAANRAARGNLSQARYELAARDQTLAACRLALTARDEEIERQTARSAEAAEQNAVLAARLEAAEARAAAAEAREIDARAEAAAHARGIERAGRIEVEALEAQRAALLGSTAWRATAPLRWTLNRARGRRSSQPLALAAPVPVDTAVPNEADPTCEVPLGSAELATVDDDATVGGAAPADSVADAAELGLPDVDTNPVTTPAERRRRVLFISGEDHTPGHFYRVERYTETARQLGWDAAWMRAEPVGPDELAGLDLVVLWRVPHSAHIAGIVQVSHENGALVVFDVDDLMFRPEMAVSEVIDGIRSQQFSELETQAFFAKIGKSLKLCDVVTCPTAELASEARRMGVPAYVLPNGFDERSHAVARRAVRERAGISDDLLRIGYAAGSRTHQRDFGQAVPAVARVLRARDDVRLVIFRDASSGEGLVLTHEFEALAGLEDRIEWRDMVTLAALPREMARFDINLAPLEIGNPFCEAKSELKYFEAGLVDVPTVASPVGSFARAMVEGVTGFLAADDAAWQAALERLLDDGALRRRIGRAAYHDALGKFGPEARARRFAAMVAQIEGGADGAAAFERDRYRAGLAAVRPPQVPDCETLFAEDRMGEAEVTVIVPVFNYADHVTEALQSVLAQKAALLDLVVVDDCSTDDSVDMVLDWARAHGGRFNRLQVLRHGRNSGLGFARNSGFAAAESPFVLPLDADNRLRPSTCSVLAERLRASGAAFVYPAIQQFGDKDAVFGTRGYSTLRLQCGNYIDAMALVRKSAWAAVGGYDHVQYGWEDYDFWCRLAEHGMWGEAIGEVLADYRVHRGSMLHTTTEVRGHKGELIADLQRRHGWLDIPR